MAITTDLLRLTLMLAAAGAIATERMSEEAVIIPITKDAAQKVGVLRVRVGVQGRQLARKSKYLLLFAEVADSQETQKLGHLSPPFKVVKVKDPESWPEETATSYIVLLGDNGAVLAFQEVPVSESGDWNNSYTHYFNEHGETVAFRRVSRFFNSGCNGMGGDDQEVAETSTYFYHSHRLIAKDYTITDAKGKKLDPARCEFPYRHSYIIHQSLRQVQEAAGLGSRLK